jgi:glycoprotein endo-alpha-1,2-mannosidase
MLAMSSSLAFPLAAVELVNDLSTVRKKIVHWPSIVKSVRHRYACVKPRHDSYPRTTMVTTMMTAIAQRKYLATVAFLARLTLGGPVAYGADAGLLEFLRSRHDRRHEQVPRQVLTFYYTWYGRPERHGRWIHWGKVDAPRFEISQSTHYPAQGAYDSHDPAIIDGHIDLAKQHGVTGFVATWWGQQTFDDRAFALLVNRAGEKDFRVTIYWETAPGQGQAQIDRAVNDVLYVLRRYGSEPAFLKVDRKPVIFVYGRVMGQVPLTSWPEIIRRVQEQYGDFVLIADGYDESFARLFDGVHTYNICGWVRDKTPDELRTLGARSFADAVKLARRHGKISCLTVIPGYDDTKIRRPGLKADRHAGQTYQTLWEEAIRADPDWVLITSWNEWHEGSEIEPSREDGDQYVRLTGQYAPRFRAMPPSPAHTSQRSPSARREIAAQLRERYRGKTVGILPDFGSEAVFWLADAGLALKELAWKDLLDPAVFNARALPLAVYAAGEHYVRSVREDGDVVRALQRYLREGGLLVAVPFRPYPFFYDETGTANVAAGQVGFPIGGSRSPSRARTSESLARGWEIPPSGVSLTFHVDTKRLQGLPSAVPFPSSGDLRWRPATRALLADGDVYVPLVNLTDERGNDYGEAIAYVEHKAANLAHGKTLYVWMRMPDVLDRDALFLAIFRFAAEQISEQ